MHHKKLLEAHGAFYRKELRANNYDTYMWKKKDWTKWDSPTLSIDEIEKLFRFIRSWDRFFKGDPARFQQIYTQIYPVIDKLKAERIEDADFTNEKLKTAIKDVFNKVADCTSIGRYESTDASKILHTILPNFFVMWDDRIKNWMVEGEYGGATYAFDFLSKVQRELEEAISTCMTERKLTRTEAVAYIREENGGQTLAKLADEYNYVKYTMRYQPL